MKIVRPINDKTPNITQEWNATHGGVDYGYKVGEAVFATADGVITQSVDTYTTAWRNNGTLTMKDYGNYIDIDHGDGHQSRYAHLKKGSQLFSKGQQVKQGQKIAEVGNTGNSTGSHLHFELRKGTKTMNPALLMDTEFTNYFIKFNDIMSPSTKLPDDFYKINEAKELVKRKLITPKDAFDTILAKFVATSDVLEKQKAHFDEETKALIEEKKVLTEKVDGITQDLNARNSYINELEAKVARLNSISKEQPTSASGDFNTKDLVKWLKNVGLFGFLPIVITFAVGLTGQIPQDTIYGVIALAIVNALIDFGKKLMTDNK